MCEAVRRIIDSFSHSLICCESSAAIWLPGRLFQEFLNFSTLGQTRSRLSSACTKHLLTQKWTKRLVFLHQNQVLHLCWEVTCEPYFNFSWGLALISVKYTYKNTLCTCVYNINFINGWPTEFLIYLIACSGVKTS